jgi:hypothetical protein
VSRPLDELLTFAERAYVRMEAEQLIGQCLDQGDPALFNDLVKGLVLAGSTSLGVMREILEEVRSTRTSLMREGMTVRQDLAEALTGFGVDSAQLLSIDSPEAFRLICSQRLRDEARRSASGLKAEDAILLEELCSEAGDRVSGIARRLMLLLKLEESVQDWISGLVYEASQLHEDWSNQGRPQPIL